MSLELVYILKPEVQQPFFHNTDSVLDALVVSKEAIQGLYMFSVVYYMANG